VGRFHPWGALLVLWGRIICMRDVIVLKELWAQGKICICWNMYWLKSFHLVPVLVPNYIQNILLPAEVRKVCYSLAALYVKICLFQFIRVERGAKLMKHLRRAQSVKFWEPMAYTFNKSKWRQKLGSYIHTKNLNSSKCRESAFKGDNVHIICSNDATAWRNMPCRTAQAESRKSS
jgi:hypothetical protein